MVILKKQMHIMKKIFGIIFLLSFLCHAQESFSKSADAIVDVADYGLMPDSCQNATEIVHDMLEELSERKFRSLKIVFRKGRYDFYPDETLQKNKETTVLFHISDMKNVTIDGNGSEFIFHGQMKPFRIDSSSEVSLKNFSVDWEVPYNAQCTVKDVTDSYLDLCIDSERYPFEIADGKLYFKGEYGLQQIEKAYANLFDPDTHNLVYRMNDVPLGQGLFDARAECLGDDTVRLHFSPSCRPEKGTVLLFHLARYLANGIEVFDSEDIRIDNVDFYHTLSCGIYAVRTKNVVMKDFNIIANEEKGRVFSTIADATHFIGCTGRIVLDGCTVTGAGDDFINVHGMYAPVTGMAGPKSVRVSPTGRDSGFLPGEKVWIVDTASMQRVMVRKVHASHRLDCTRDYVVEFNDDTGDISGHILENASACPEVLIKNCVMLKKNRARSVLVTTPKKVVIKDNYFNSAGAAVLIEGDIRLWYESGGVRNVLIKNNPQGVELNYGNSGVDGQRGHYARWDPTTAECWIRVAAYNKDNQIKNSWLFGAAGDDQPAEVWRLAGDTFTCNRDLFGFSLMNKTSTAAVVGIGGGAVVGAGVGAIAGHGARDFDCSLDKHRELLTEELRTDANFGSISEYLEETIPANVDVMTRNQCEEVVDLYNRYIQVKEALKKCNTIEVSGTDVSIYSQVEASCKNFTSLEDCFKGIDILQPCIGKGYTDLKQCTDFVAQQNANNAASQLEGSAITEENEFCSFQPLNLARARGESIYCNSGETGCIDSVRIEVDVERLDKIFNSDIEDLLRNGEESNIGKSIAIGTGVGVGAGGLATAITAFVERSNISCHVGDGLAQVGYGKSYSIESLKDFYVKWNLNLPDTITPTGTAVDCDSWKRACGTIKDLNQCKSAQINYKPADAATITLVPTACTVSGSACIENYPVAKSYGACE